MTSESNSTPSKKKGNVILNPKKEDLMKESLRRKINGQLEGLKEAAKKKSKDASKKAKRWWDDDGDGVGYEKGEVDGKFSKKNEETTHTDAELQEALKAQEEEISRRMMERMNLMQQTIEHDRKRFGIN